jgi:ABC-type transport system involved in cytochrome bd biosynthesis fused ATPase/permease subunit
VLGQRQRISLARCFLRKSKILFLDEATSSLDAESESLVQAAIDRLINIRQCTVILVAHRLSTVINAHQICVISGGNIAEHGTHEQLLKLDGIYAKLVAKQLARQHNTINADEHPDIINSTARTSNNQSISKESKPEQKSSASSDVIDNLIE